MYFRKTSLLSIVIFLTLAGASHATGIPYRVPYSGVVSVDGQAFNGNGRFKFAIVDEGCTTGEAGITFWTNDDGNVSNDCRTPASDISLTVLDGRFDIKLGDTVVPNMVSIPTTVFENKTTYLRIWFNDSVNDFQVLTPDRQLVSVPYAYRAETADALDPTSTTAVTVAEHAMGINANVTAIGNNANLITAHKTSTDHDGRYYTEMEVDAKTSANAATISGNTTAINAHKTSTDHDGRYYTEAEVDTKTGANATAISGNTTAINAHKTSADHDGRYYTEAEVDTKTGANATAINGNTSAINVHKTSADHDVRYYTKTQVDNTFTSQSQLAGHAASGDHDSQYYVKSESMRLGASLSVPLAGTVFGNTNTTSVSGTGTSFRQELNINDAIMVEGQVFTVVSIADNVNLQIDRLPSTAFDNVTAYKDENLLELRDGANKLKATVTKSGRLIRSIAHATGNGPEDGTDSGRIVSRTLMFNKERADTEIRIGYTDGFRVSGLGGACRWEIRVIPVPPSGIVDETSSCSTRLNNDFYSGSLTLDLDIHRHSNVVGYCSGALVAGPHEIRVYVSPVPGYEGLTNDCYTGWLNSTWVLEAEEVN